MSQRVGIVLMDRQAEAALSSLPAQNVQTVDLDRGFEQLIAAVLPADVPSPARTAQALRNATERLRFLAENEMIDAEGVATLAGSRARNRRATAHRWREHLAIFGVDKGNQTWYPRFQFDEISGQPKAAVGEVLRSLPAAMKGWALAMWWDTPNDLLDGQRPVDVLDRRCAEVVAAATREAADWATDSADAPR